jgi:CubicO group peptidase (beta-lactamase class C family)
VSDTRGAGRTPRAACARRGGDRLSRGGLSLTAAAGGRMMGELSSGPGEVYEMSTRVPRYVALAILHMALGWGPAAAGERPASGKPVPGLEPIDKAVLRFMDTIDCQAATVAVSKDGRLVYARGFGWLDKERTQPLPPDALMRIASVTKPVTAATVRNAVRAGRLRLDDKAFDVICVKPPGGKVADARIKDVTIGQLLAHKGGWDRNQSFDPMLQTRRIEKELGLTGAATPANVIEYMLGQPLQFAPGEKAAYSNFGYCVLGRVLEAAMKEPYGDCVQHSICKPLGIKDMRLGSSAAAKRDPREVWYPVPDDAFPLEVMDAHGGLIASAPALCRFLQAYWISGEPRRPGQKEDWVSFGSLPGTTAMVRQREDGINVVVLCNGRRDKHFEEDNESLKKMMDEAIDAIVKKK